MEASPEDERPQRRLTLSRWAPSMAGGLVIGVLLRRVPLAAAEQLAGDESAAATRCGDRSVLECSLDNLGSLGAALIELLVVVLAVCALLVLAGVVLVVGGLVRRTAWLVALGAAVGIPGVWQLTALGLTVLS